MKIIIIRGIFAGRKATIVCKATNLTLWVRMEGHEPLMEIYNQDYAIPVV